MNIEHFLINFNMGCIETILTTLLKKLLKRLTLTWDVLKQTEDSQLPFPFPINFNMGCIETALAVGLNLSEVGLTLTWDVLKRAFTLDICASKSD